MDIIKLKGKYNHQQLTTARRYRGYSQSYVCKHIDGLSQPNLSKFEQGYHGCISDDLLILIMKFLEFPLEWMYQDCKEVKILGN